MDDERDLLRIADYDVRRERVVATLTDAQRSLVGAVVHAAESARADLRDPLPFRTPTWLLRLGLTDSDWRMLKLLPPGAVTAVAMAQVLDEGRLTAPVMVDIGTYPQRARPADPAWVPDRVAIDDTALSVRGEIGVVCLTPDNRLLRCVVRDIPLGGLRDPGGETSLAAVFDDFERHVRRPGAPLSALGLDRLPVLADDAKTLAVARDGPRITVRQGLDALPALRHRVERTGTRLCVRLNAARSPLMADLAPLERDHGGRLRVAGGPRVLLHNGLVERLRDRQLPGAERHRTSLDDVAMDGQSYLGVYASGFGLPDESGQFEPAAIVSYQTAVPGLFLISNWALQAEIVRQELAAAVHCATAPELRRATDRCRDAGRGWADARRPALRDPCADSLAAEIERVHYMFARLRELD